MTLMPRQVYVLNLDSRPDRWAKVYPHLRSHGLDVIRISAVLGSSLTVDPHSVIKAEKCLNRRLSVLGCKLSHLKALRAVVTSNTPAFIAEDDVCLAENFTAAYAAFERVSPRGLLVAKYGGNHAYSGSPTWEFPSKSYGLHFYRVTPLGAMTLIKNAIEIKDHAIDDCYRGLLKERKMAVALPALAKQRVGSSDITNTYNKARANSVFVESNFVIDGV